METSGCFHQLRISFLLSKKRNLYTPDMNRTLQYVRHDDNVLTFMFIVTSMSTHCWAEAPWVIAKKKNRKNIRKKKQNLTC